MMPIRCYVLLAHWLRCLKSLPKRRDGDIRIIRAAQELPGKRRVRRVGNITHSSALLRCVDIDVQNAQEVAEVFEQRFLDPAC
jgi:hypothetical protein